MNKKKNFDVLFFLNDEERAYLYKMEAQQDHFESMVYYAYYQYYGLGVPVNKEEAAKYFKIAADVGDKKVMGFYSKIPNNEIPISVNTVDCFLNSLSENQNNDIYS